MSLAWLNGILADHPGWPQFPAHKWPEACINTGIKRSRLEHIRLDHHHVPGRSTATARKPMAATSCRVPILTHVAEENFVPWRKSTLNGPADERFGSLRKTVSFWNNEISEGLWSMHIKWWMLIARINFIISAPKTSCKLLHCNMHPCITRSGHWSNLFQPQKITKLQHGLIKMGSCYDSLRPCYKVFLAY